MQDDNRKSTQEIFQQWQQQKMKERDYAKEHNQTFHEPSFTVFVSSVAMQAMIALGRIENPATGKRQSHPEQARFLIETLGIIEEKTKNNLDSPEENFLRDSLDNLRLIYLEEKEKEDETGGAL